jgi:4-hydroxybenzoyl-CoA thioesterase
VSSRDAPGGRNAPPPLAALPAAAWRGDQKVRFSHCDPAGIVYFARYFDLMNGAVEDFFSEALGLSYAEFIGPRRVGLGYGHVEADFARVAAMGEILTFAILVERIGNASLALAVHAYRGEEPILTMRSVIVTTSLVEHRAIPIPDDLRAALARYEEACR